MLGVRYWVKCYSYPAIRVLNSISNPRLCNTSTGMVLGGSKTGNIYPLVGSGSVYWGKHPGKQGYGLYLALYTKKDSGTKSPIDERDSPGNKNAG